MQNRRSFLGHLAAVTATVPAVVAGAAMALTSPAGPDPIFSKIAEHKAAVCATDAANARFLALDPAQSDDAAALVSAGLFAECRVARAVIETAPTTRAGLQALE